MALPTRRSYAGAADGCTLTGAISAGDTTATLTGTVTNWPSTGTGPFYMVIDPGLSAEEKVLVTTRSSGTISVMSRGQDGTTAAAHAAGAVAYPVGAAVDFDEANSALSKMTTKGDLLVTTGSAYDRLGVGTNGYLLKADSSAANGVSWTDYSASPTFTGTVTGNPAAGTTSTGTSGFGYMGLPQNTTTTGAYGVVAADAGKHIYSSATRTVTIPANATIAMPVGATVVFIAGSGATVTIAITTDTMYWSFDATTGSRTLAPFGMATAVKIDSATWVISGSGLT